MSGDWYTPTGSPATRSQGSSSTMRAEFLAIEAAIDKLPAIGGNADELVKINSGGTALEVLDALKFTGGNRLEVTGSVIINTTTPATGTPSLDVVGKLCGADVVTDATDKDFFISVRHRTNAEETVQLIRGQSTSADNIIAYGGSGGLHNAATRHAFYTAAGTTTLAGTERVRITENKMDFLTTVAIGQGLGSGQIGAALYVTDSGGQPGFIRTENNSTFRMFYGRTDAPLDQKNTILITDTDGIRLNFFSDASVQGDVIWNAKRSGSSLVNLQLAQAGGDVLIGHAVPATGSPRLDLVGPAPQVSISDTTANATSKFAWITGRHFTNAEENVGVISSSSLAGGTEIAYGGGVGGFNAATMHRIYTAANTITTTGAEQVRLTNTFNNFVQNVSIGAAVGTTPLQALDVRGNIYYEGVTPRLVTNETDATADNGRWDMRAQTEQLEFRAVNDGETVASHWCEVNRTGTTIDTVNFPNGTLQSLGNAVYYTSGPDVAVTDGGTGVSSLTDHGVLLGSGTGAVSVTGAGTAGEVLTSNGASLDPTFQTRDIPSGTVMLFYQSAAPTGWTKDIAATLDNSALRVVTSTAWAAGVTGATNFNSVFGASKVTGAHTLTTSEIPSHAHEQRGWTSGTGANRQIIISSSVSSASTSNTTASNAFGGNPTNSVGSGGSHTHTLSLDMRYINVIRATKD